MDATVAAALRFSLIFLVSAVAYAGSAQWNPNPASGDWNTATNWTPITVPNGPADIATFALSNTTDVSISEDTEVNGITFTSAATNPYFISVSPRITLTLSGTGITDNSGIAQVLFCDPIADGFEGGQILFTNSASASSADITSYGSLQFSNNSSAGSADIMNGGYTVFSDGATASSANILNFSPSSMRFFDSSTAGNANVLSYDATFIDFAGSSTAGSATITSLGEIFFYESSGGGTARVGVFQQFGRLSGILDISPHNAPGVTIGSIEGDGDVVLGANNLTVGSNNLNTIFSGVIWDDFATTPTNMGTGAVDFTRASSYNERPRPERGVLKTYDSSSSNTRMTQNGALAGSAVGSLTKIGAGTLDLEGVNTYTGNTNINGGVLQVDGSISSDTFVNPGGTLAGSGTVNGNITNRGGKISPGDATGEPGVLTVGGDYTTLASLTAGGTLSIQIGGANVGQVSVLDVQGHANLGGFLDPVLLNGFVPEIGQSFTFLNYASFTGFLRIRNPVFDHGRKRWLLTYNPTSVVLTVIGAFSGRR